MTPEAIEELRRLTERELDVLRHALGIQKRGGKWTKPYRNHYVAGGDDVALWDALVASGHARLSHKGGTYTGEMPVYVVTESGRAAALAGLHAEGSG